MSSVCAGVGLETGPVNALATPSAHTSAPSNRVVLCMMRAICCALRSGVASVVCFSRRHMP